MALALYSGFLQPIWPVLQLGFLIACFLVVFSSPTEAGTFKRPQLLLLLGCLERSHTQPLHLSVANELNEPNETIAPAHPTWVSMVECPSTYWVSSAHDVYFPTHLFLFYLGGRLTWVYYALEYKDVEVLADNSVF